MRKLLIPLIILTIMLFQSGCYVTKAARLNDIVGTYELTGYNRTGEDAFDYKEENGMVAYLVIKDANSGYYIYKDNWTDLSVRAVQITLTADEEEPNKYNFVTYKLDSITDEVKLGIHSGNLNSSIPKSSGNLLDGTYNAFAAYINTDYKRVNKATDLSFVKKQLGELPAVTEYGLSAYDGIYYYNHYNIDNMVLDYNTFSRNYTEPFIYAMFDLNIYTQKATVYYALKNTPIEKKQVEYSFSISQSDGVVMFNIGAKTYPAELKGKNAYMFIPQTTVIEEAEIPFDLAFIKSARNTTNLENQINWQIEYYEQQIADQQNTAE